MQIIRDWALYTCSTKVSLLVRFLPPFALVEWWNMIFMTEMVHIPMKTISSMVLYVLLYSFERC